MGKIEPKRAVVAGVAVTAGLAGLAVWPAHANEFRVVATIKPVHALVAQVMDGVGTPEVLLKGQSSPHTYSMKPSDAKALNSAAVVFRVSEEIEPFTKKIIASLPASVSVVTLADTTGLLRLKTRGNEGFDAHDHSSHGGDDDHSSHETKHTDHDGHDHDSDAKASYDGHVWLDPENAMMMVAEIARVLSEKSPENAAAFQANATKAIRGIEALKAEIAENLAPVKGKPFAVFHDAYQYFETAFDMKAVGSITVSPEVQPSAKRLSEVRAKIKSLNAACVFAEPQFKTGLVDTVIEGTGAKAGLLDPEGATIEPGPNAYHDLMRGLANGLRSCLG
jgi:zinc transport system substrate-binding protein